MGRGAEHGADVAVRDTRKVASKLIDGVGWTAGEVGKGFDALGRAIDTLGAKTAPHSR